MKKFTQLSKDIEKDDNIIDIEKVKNDEYDIESVIDVFFGHEDDSINENGLVAVNMDLSQKEVKRGDIVYITAMIRKSGSSMTSPSTQSVIKLRIVDIYSGLSYLNKIIK